MQGKPAIPDVFTMSNYAKNEGRIELHDKLSLTGTGVPFTHSHKSNEEIYGILEGAGKAVIDGAEIPLAAGDWLKIAPAAKRQFFAAADCGIPCVCIQVKAHSLGDFTADDAIVY